MKWKCSLNDNYEIINMCNIDKFNNKINQFSDKSWTEIAISQKFEIPYNNPSVKNIFKVYLNVKITSTKLIKTPSSDETNIEGKTLTGNLLLIFGEISQRIIYISETDLTYSINYKDFFNTYIVIDKNINLSDSSYCVYPCIENFFITPLNKRTLIKNIHLFLFAHNQNYIQKLPNKIIIKSQNNYEVLSIEFDSKKQKFIVTSTKKVPNPNSTDTYFTLILKNQSATIDLLTITLKSNENGENFKNALNNKEFEYTNNKLVLIYKDKTKIEISNFPNSKNTYIPSFDSDIFEISNNGLVDKSFNNKIIIFNDNNEKVSTLQFIKTGIAPVLTPTSNGTISTNLLENNIKYIQLLNYSSSQLEFSGELLGKEDATQFVASLNNKIIIPKSPLRLSNRISNRIIITNYDGKSEHRIGEEPEFFKSTETELIPYDLNYNKIRVKNLNGSTILFIYFNKVDLNTIYVEPYATGVLNNDSDYFSFKIRDPNETIIKVEATMTKGETGDVIVKTVGNSPSNIFKNFNFGDILELDYSNPSLVEIFDIPTKGLIATLHDNFEKFEITEDGLVLANLSKLLITFKGIDEKIIATLKFDIIHQKLIATSTNEQANPLFNNEEYFAVIFKDSIKNIQKEAIVRGNDTANTFMNILNNMSFTYNDILIIRSKEGSKIFIANYPNLHQNSNPFLSEDSFKITKLGLESLYKYLNNIITFKGINNTVIAQLRFNKDLKKLSIGDNSSIVHTGFKDNEYFAIVFNDFKGNFKNEVSVKGTDTGKVLTNSLNGKSFDYSDVITLRYKELNKVLISNYPNTGDIFNPPNNTSSFLITQNGLNLITFFFNSIYVENTEKSQFVEIKFIAALNTLFILNKGVKANPSFGSDEYFKFVLKDFNNRVKYETSVNENEDASSLVRNLGGVKFENSDIISLKYKDNNRVFLLNYPNLGEKYTPSNFSDDFIFNNNKIEPLIPPKPIIKLQTYFSFKTFNTSNEMAKVEFDIVNKKLIATSTSLPYNNPSIQIAFKFELLSSDEITVKNFETINGNEDATRFKNTLNGRVFEVGDLIKLEFNNSQDVDLIDYPNLGDNYNMQTSKEQVFKITQNGITPYVLLNTIILKDKNNDPIVMIQFDILSKAILINSTGKVANPGGMNYFVLKLYQSDGKTQKQTASIGGGKNADNFKGIYSNTNYEFGDIIELQYEERQQVNISNFVYSPTPNYTPFKTSEKYIITKNGLAVSTLSTYFVFKTYDTKEEMVRVEFDTLNKRVRATSSGKYCNYTDNSIVFLLDIYEKSQRRIRSIIHGKENANKFRNELTGVDFNYNDIVTVAFITPGPKVVLINYPKLGDVYEMPTLSSKVFVITPTGIIE